MSDDYEEFNLEKALADPSMIRLRNGDPYKFGAYNPDARPSRRVLGWQNGDLHSADTNGRWHGGGTTELDLVLAPAIEKVLQYESWTRVKD